MKSTKLILLSIFALAACGLATPMANASMTKGRYRHPNVVPTSSVTTTNTASYNGRHYNRWNKGCYSRGYYGAFGYPYGYGGFGYPFGYGYGGYGGGYGYGYQPFGIGLSFSSSPRYRAVGRGSVVVEVQRRLAREGYYRGAIDGVAGYGTRNAIRAFERTHGLRVDGEIDGRLLATLGIA